MSSRRIHHRRLATLLLPFALLACDDDPSGPDATASGTVTASITDGSGSSLRANQMMSGSFAGSASGDAQVWIYSETRGWVALGNATESRVALQSSQETTVHSSARVDADSYTRVRLVLDGFDASVAAGATLGGLTLDADAIIRMGGSDGRVEIEKAVSGFTVTADGSSQIVFDLNSEAWIDQESAEAGSEGDAEIMAAAAVVVR